MRFNAEVAALARLVLVRSARPLVFSWLRSSSQVTRIPHLNFPAKMSDKEDNEPVELGKWALDATIKGVVARLRDGPPEKRGQ
jgi:hypothetical protein